MLVEREDVFYYVTVMNENAPQPSMPAGAEEHILRGMHCVARPERRKPRVHLLGSGMLLAEAIAAAELLETDWKIDADVWSVTSWSELAREAREVERDNRLRPESAGRTAHLQTCLADGLPVVAVSDWVRALPQLIASYLPNRFSALGTDGFGRSDTRIALRRFFEVDRQHIALAALGLLAGQGQVEAATVRAAIERYGIDAEAIAPWRC
jgi:pyruvate dehydrogenase E1 component